MSTPLKRIETTLAVTCCVAAAGFLASLIMLDAFQWHDDGFGAGTMVALILAGVCLGSLIPWIRHRDLWKEPKAVPKEWVE
jgi:predicted histidine transporter YuiF (NhaC family)